MYKKKIVNASLKPIFHSILNNFFPNRIEPVLLFLPDIHYLGQFDFGYLSNSNEYIHT